VFSRKAQIRKVKARLAKVEAELSEKRRLRSRLYARMQHLHREQDRGLAQPGTRHEPVADEV
jgi:hypothetical protein